MPTPYESLLQDFANSRELSAQDLLLTQEIMVDDVLVSLVYEGLDDAGDLVFYSSLGSPAKDQLLEAYRLMLLSNHLWSGTGGATLGLQDDGRASLCHRTPLNQINADGLATTLGLFAGQAAQWRGIIGFAEAVSQSAEENVSAV